MQNKRKITIKGKERTTEHLIDFNKFKTVLIKSIKDVLIDLNNGNQTNEKILLNKKKANA